MGDLFKNVSIGEFCGGYQAAVTKIRQGFDLIAEARADLHRLGAGTQMFDSSISDYSFDKPEHLAERSVDQLQRSTWRELIRRSQVRDVMTSKRAKVLDEQIEHGTLPPIQPDAVVALLDNLRVDLSEIVTESIKEAADVLRPRDRAYKTNRDGWSLGKRVVIQYGVSFTYGDFSGILPREAAFNAVDNAFHLLDGAGPARYPNRLVDAIQGTIHTRRKDPGPMACETPYFKAKWHKNGTVHLEFKRLDLVEKLNRAAADHTTLRDESLAGVVNLDARRGPVAPPPVPTVEQIRQFNDADRREQLGFFETPDELADELVRLAQIGHPEEAFKVLEPSAGCGAIVEAVNRAPVDAIVHAIEIDPAHVERLTSVVGAVCGPRPVLGDFLSIAPRPEFDAVIANPPFAGGRDVHHVRRMFDWLKPGGRVVSVMSASVTFRQDRLYADFREWVEQVGGVIDPLPEGSFKESGTGVNTVVCVIDKPAA